MFLGNVDTPIPAIHPGVAKLTPLAHSRVPDARFACDDERGCVSNIVELDVISGAINCNVERRLVNLNPSPRPRLLDLREAASRTAVRYARVC